MCQKIVAISGSGQQHGSVYWNEKSESNILTKLDANKSLLSNLESAFAISDAPIWMDSSTTLQCQQLANKMGGKLNVAQISGCIPIERFTGNQIAKLYHNSPQLYHKCERISLVSSFMCSVFLGKYAPIDVSDGLSIPCVH
jgi:xylulokinase